MPVLAAWRPNKMAMNVAVDPPAAPVLAAIDNDDLNDAYTVSWGAAARANTYVLEEDDNAEFTSPTEVYSGTGLSHALTGKPVDVYYYRVKAVGDGGDSDWSSTESVEVPEPPVYIEGDFEIWTRISGVDAQQELYEDVEEGDILFDDTVSVGDPVHFEAVFPTANVAAYTLVYEFESFCTGGAVEVAMYNTSAGGTFATITENPNSDDFGPLNTGGVHGTPVLSKRTLRFVMKDGLTYPIHSNLGGDIQSSYNSVLRNIWGDGGYCKVTVRIYDIVER